MAVGAGAGIGGNGGTGGNGSSTQTGYLGTKTFCSNPIINTNCGFDGDDGESAGTINIYNSLKVYAYGGAGKSGGYAGSSSGAGGGGYPAAGIGRWSEPVGGGGNHSEGGGGFSGGGAQTNTTNGVNGLGGGTDAISYYGTGGGGYFGRGYGSAAIVKGTAVIGGMGGGPWLGNADGSYNTDAWFTDHAGYGGIAGSGGTVTVSTTATIYAYNGDMITNGNYETTYYEYEKDGSTTSTELTIITKRNGDKIIPCKIFAQSGIIRATYTTNQGEYSLSRVTRTLAEGETLPDVATSYDTVELVLATDETTCDTTGYSNGYMSNQGIGSGAGYIEVSNGSYTVDSSMN